MLKINQVPTIQEQEELDKLRENFIGETTKNYHEGYTIKEISFTGLLEIKVTLKHHTLCGQSLILNLGSLENALEMLKEMTQPTEECDDLDIIINGKKYEIDDIKAIKEFLKKLGEI